jgi:hypothetical protein
MRSEQPIAYTRNGRFVIPLYGGVIVVMSGIFGFALLGMLLAWIGHAVAGPIGAGVVGLVALFAVYVKICFALQGGK